jgi:integrase
VKARAHGPSDTDPINEPLKIAARTDPLSATLVITGAYTGMLWGELTGLAWSDVLLDQDIPEIRIPKDEGALHEIGGKLWLDAPKTDSAVRTVALPPFLAALLTAMREGARTDFVFTAERGGWLRRSNFRRRTWDPCAGRECGSGKIFVTGVGVEDRGVIGVGRVCAAGRTGPVRTSGV